MAGACRNRTCAAPKNCLSNRQRKPRRGERWGTLAAGFTWSLMKANHLSHLCGPFANHVRENGQNVAWAGGGSGFAGTARAEALNNAGDDLAANLPGSEPTLYPAIARYLAIDRRANGSRGYGPMMQSATCDWPGPQQNPDAAGPGHRKGGLDAQSFRLRGRGYRVAGHWCVGEPGRPPRLLFHPLRQALKSIPPPPRSFDSA
jgi:hypothetical protein